MRSTTHDIQTTVDLLADLPVYEQEKPFFLHLSASPQIDVNRLRNTNVKWAAETVTVRSMRDVPGATPISLEKNGFCYVSHASEYLPTSDMGVERIAKYRAETESFLQSHFQAEAVHCYGFKLRKNTEMTKDVYDPNDLLLREGAAVGAHVDITLETVPELLQQVLPGEKAAQYLQPGYRFRLINTWRPTLPICEDRPLAFCDYTSITPEDLIPCDRVFPNRAVQEIYLLRKEKNANAGQQQRRWYWLPDQRSDEPFLFVTFDSRSSSSEGEKNARCCPHVSVHNPLAPLEAPPRESVETRNLVITKV